MSVSAAGFDPKCRFSKKVLFGLIALSILLRVLLIPNYLIEAHGFRQTQTAITVQDWINHGFDLIHYRTPVLGAPWTLPMEFPTFQASAYGMYHVLLPITSNLDVALRVTGLVYFYLSFAVFCWLAKILFSRLEKGGLYYKVAAIIYLFSPFAVFWSRTSMIEYCAVFFQLLYAGCFLKILYDADRKKVFWFFSSLVSGGIGYLTKSTTMVPAVVFLFVCSLLWYWPKLQKFRTLLVRNEILKILCLFVIAVFPFVVGILWVRYSDNVKIQSGYRFLTSNGLETWNFGTLGERFNVSYHVRLLKNLEEALPMILLVISGGFFFFCRREAEDGDSRRKKKQLCIALILAVVVTVWTLFNLYSAHNYYSTAIFPFLVLAGGILYTDFIVYAFFNKKKLLMIVSAGLLLFHIGFSPLVRLQTWRPDHSQDGNVATGLWIKEHSSEDDVLLVLNHDWSSVLPYYANRRALMVNDSMDNRDTVDQSFSDYQILVTGASEEEWFANSEAFAPPQSYLINTENGNLVFRIQKEPFDTSQYPAGNDLVTVLLQEQNGVMIGYVASEATVMVKAVYCKAGDIWTPTWLNCDGSGKIRFALKTDLPENSEMLLAIVYENSSGEKFVSEVFGEWR